MTLFDENNQNANNGAPEPAELPSAPVPVESNAPAFADSPIGDPFLYGATHPQPNIPISALPLDLQIPWSWGNFTCFIFYIAVSILVGPSLVALFFLPHGKSFTNATEFQQYILSKPGFVVASTVLQGALLLLFLYVSLKVIYGAPVFWRSLGWRKLNPQNLKAPVKPWLYLALGCGLSVLVMVGTIKLKPPEHAPIQDILKYPGTALAAMAMAVLVAPIVEETVFRGYLYPLFAKSLGMIPSIVITGTLFGLMHGYQLGWAWGLVALLTGVGIIFTVARARSETVFASFLMHLGYNSTIAIISTLGLIATKYMKIPPPHH